MTTDFWSTKPHVSRFYCTNGAYVLLLFETVETVVFAINPRFKPWAEKQRREIILM